MKKLLTIAVCASAVAALADTTINLGTVGVTKISSSAKNTIVVTSYTELDGSSASQMAVSNVIKTANLTAGDKLYVLNAGGTAYEGYTLAYVSGSSGPMYWNKDLNYSVNAQGIASSGTESTSPAIPSLDVGKGFWLSRASAPSGSFDFYIYGAPAASSTVTAAAGKTTLVGNPTQTSKAPSITGMAKGDKIMVFEGNNTLPTVYTSSGSAWRNASTRTEGLPTITAGTGFWYVSKGSSAVSIAW